MKAVLIGTGWRAHFYMRIARLLPDLLQIVSIYTHTEERRREIDDEGFEAFTDLDQALSYDHEAVIISSGASDPDSAPSCKLSPWLCRCLSST